MFYVIWRNQHGKVMGFITESCDGSFFAEGCEMEECPKGWNTKEEAEKDMKGHLLEHYSEIIEL